MHEANIVEKTLDVQVKLCHSSATSQCDTLLAYAPRESHSMAITFNVSHLEALLIAAAIYTRKLLQPREWARFLVDLIGYSNSP